MIINFIFFINTNIISQCNSNFTLSGSGEGDYALGDNGQEMFCTSNKAKFVFDVGFGVDILYLWCIAEQYDIFNDILVDVGSLGGSSAVGVKGTRVKGTRADSSEKKEEAEQGARHAYCK